MAFCLRGQSTSIFFSLLLTRRAASQFGRGALHWLSCLAKRCFRILLRHLFWNTSSVWHIPLVTFQYSAAYSSTLSTLLLKMPIFVFVLVIFVFQMFFRAANAPLALLVLVLISACVSIFCHFGSQVCELCYVFYVLFSEFDWVCCLTVVSHCFCFVFVDMKSNFRCISDQFLSFTLYVSAAVYKQRYVVCKVYVS